MSALGEGPSALRTITEAARALRAGAVTSVELLDAATARADAYDRRLGVYLVRHDAAARAAAERADAERAAGMDRGPLHGIPIAIKDIFATCEAPTTAQSLVSDPRWGAGRDAPAVARLRTAGAVLTGKLTTMEHAIGVPDADTSFPLPSNPWNTSTWAGGSSSGAGAGVAAGMFFAGLGSDTGGSIRVPAAFCGVCGLMPTYGRVPKSGAMPLAFTLDHVGPLARSARDCGAVLEAIAGPDPTDHTSRAAPSDHAHLAGSLAGVRIGVERVNHLGRDGEDAALAGVFEDAVAHLRALGATVVEVVLPRYQEVFAAYWVTMVCEALAQHGEDLRERWDDYLVSTRTTISAGALYSGADYVQAQRLRRVAQRDLAALFAAVDLIVMPTANQGAPDHEELRSGAPMSVFGRTFTPYWDALGNPVLAIPMGFASTGLPLSLQLAARPFEEALLVCAGDAFQRATDWHLREPAFVHRSAAPAGVGHPPAPAAAADVSIDAHLAAAGLDPPPADRARMLARYAALRPAVDALHAEPACRGETPALVFEAQPSLEVW